MMKGRTESDLTPPYIRMFSKPTDGAVLFDFGYEAQSDPSVDEQNAYISATNTFGFGTPLNFHAAEFNFSFKQYQGADSQTGVMNVDGKIVCKEEIRVAEVNTNKVNTNEVNTQGINAKEIKVEMGNAADYVFDEEYDLKPLDEVEAFVKSNKHLPGVPSASEFKENGMNVSEMSNLLLEKVEELTLHLIRLQKEVEQLKEENNALKKQVNQ